ncbi:hypothetical protein PTE30175_05392 [Pandoraea terrae]|uniref:Uncharacterized protein n=1 Tax=Pandoraea terrae TaxID=1537710 RepID=A0A5E4ZER5_9BURK|nr:hypothetical protein [Pandoraea terrae]VVE59167.1 hypothetical protein PTE30175_05392 [Pandoraea terrae]
MTPPACLTAIDWIVARRGDDVRCALNLAGHDGWCCSTPAGFCVATEIPIDDPTDIPTRWLHGITLAVAGSADLQDDQLCIANAKLWWVHHFSASACTAVVEAHLNRQLLACDLLARQAEQARPANADHASIRP